MCINHINAEIPGQPCVLSRQPQLKNNCRVSMRSTLGKGKGVPNDSVNQWTLSSTNYIQINWAVNFKFSTNCERKTAAKIIK